MRIAIDATSALLRSAGIKNYTYHWMRHLRRLAQGDEVRGFPYLGELGILDHEASVLPLWRTVPRIAVLHAVNTMGPLVLDAVLGGTDIFHTSNQVRCAPTHARLTATLHDLTCWLMPQLHTEGNRRADQNFADRILRRAGGLIAVSENTRQDAIRLLHLPAEKIETIHSGVAEEYFDPAPARRGRPYVLYVGTIEPRKNLDTLLDAWRAVKPDLRREFELVIAGPMGWNVEKTAARIRAEATYLGYVPEADLPGLTAGASLFVYPSLYEGFGFPVVQAMAARVPVLTSNTSCLPEITGGGALLVDPASAAEIAAGLTRLLESESQRQDLAARGRQRAEAFKWETCAAKSWEFFRKLI